MTGRNLCAVVTAAVAAGVLAGYVPVPPIEGPATALWRHAAGAAPMDEFSPPTEGRPACLVTTRIQNDTRRVFGSIRQECIEPILFIGHSAPFGNWGVDSERGRRYDGNQFAGWKRKGDMRQWNSCTEGRHEFLPPNSDYYNDNGYTTQKAAPDDVNTHALYYQWGRRDEPCSRRARTYVHRNPYMKLYELDWPDSDDRVTTLRFPTLTVPVTCSNDWRCEGQSRWRPSNRNSSVSARVRVKIDMGRNS